MSKYKLNQGDFAFDITLLNDYQKDELLNRYSGFIHDGEIIIKYPNYNHDVVREIKQLTRMFPFGQYKEKNEHH